jgi:hypothetical protein
MMNQVLNHRSKIQMLKNQILKFWNVLEEPKSRVIVDFTPLMTMAASVGAAASLNEVMNRIPPLKNM